MIPIFKAKIKKNYKYPFVGARLHLPTQKGTEAADLFINNNLTIVDADRPLPQKLSPFNICYLKTYPSVT